MYKTQAKKKLPYDPHTHNHETADNEQVSDQTEAQAGAPSEKTTLPLNPHTGKISRQALTPQNVLALQRTIGNRAVRHLLTTQPAAPAALARSASQNSISSIPQTSLSKAESASEVKTSPSNQVPAIQRVLGLSASARVAVRARRAALQARQLIAHQAVTATALPTNATATPLPRRLPFAPAFASASVPATLASSSMSHASMVAHPRVVNPSLFAHHAGVGADASAATGSRGARSPRRAGSDVSSRMWRMAMTPMFEVSAPTASLAAAAGPRRAAPTGASTPTAPTTATGASTPTAASTSTSTSTSTSSLTTEAAQSSSGGGSSSSAAAHSAKRVLIGGIISAVTGYLASQLDEVKAAVTAKVGEEALQQLEEASQPIREIQAELEEVLQHYDVATLEIIGNSVTTFFSWLGSIVSAGVGYLFHELTHYITSNLPTISLSILGLTLGIPPGMLTAISAVMDIMMGAHLPAVLKKLMRFVLELKMGFPLKDLATKIDGAKGLLVAADAQILAFDDKFDELLAELRILQAAGRTTDMLLRLHRLTSTTKWPAEVVKIIKDASEGGEVPTDFITKLSNKRDAVKAQYALIRTNAQDSLTKFEGFQSKITALSAPSEPLSYGRATAVALISRSNPLGAVAAGIFSALVFSGGSGAATHPTTPDRAAPPARDA